MRTRRPFTTYRRGDPHPESGARSSHAPTTWRPEFLRRPASTPPQPQAPAKPAAEPIRPAKKKAYAGAKRGPKEIKPWTAIARRLQVLRKAGKLPDRNAAFHAVKDWLAKKNKTMANSTIYAGLDRHCAGWWPDSVTGNSTGK